MDKLQHWWEATVHVVTTIGYVLGWVFSLAAVVMFVACVVVIAAVVADHRADKESAAAGRRRARQHPPRTLPGEGSR
jgi:ABC-type iron transport system FetAB permease component